MFDGVADVLGRPREGVTGTIRYVRIRRALSDDGAGDLDAIVRPGLDGIMAPKVTRADEVEWLATELDARERDAKIPPGTIRSNRTSARPRTNGLSVQGGPSITSKPISPGSEPRSYHTCPHCVRSSTSGA